MSNLTYIERVVSKRPFGYEYNENLTYHFPFEEVDPFFWHSFCKENWHVPFVFGGAYVAIIFGIRRYMRDRPAFDLKMPLFWWNFTLGVFSVFGFIRTLPAFVSLLEQPNGFYTSICEKKGVDIQTGAWTVFFVLSKFWELGDTVFIVLRKKPLVFLQWYHHLVTMAVTWVLAPYMEPVVRWYTVMNYGVHSLMYPYFALKGIGWNIPSTFAKFITTLQLAQMIIAFGVNMLSLYYQQMGYNCIRYLISIRVFGLVYGTFLILFGKLFYDAVIRSGRNRKDKERLLKRSKAE